MENINGIFYNKILASDKIIIIIKKYIVQMYLLRSKYLK